MMNLYIGACLIFSAFGCLASHTPPELHHSSVISTSTSSRTSLGDALGSSEITTMEQLSHLDAHEYWTMLHARPHHRHAYFSSRLVLSAMQHTCEATDAHRVEQDVLYVTRLLEMMPGGEVLPCEAIATNAKRLEGLLRLALHEFRRVSKGEDTHGSNALSEGMHYPVLNAPSTAIFDRIVWNDAYILRTVIEDYMQRFASIAGPSDLTLLGLHYFQRRRNTYPSKIIPVDMSVAKHDAHWLRAFYQVQKTYSAELNRVFCLERSARFTLLMYLTIEEYRHTDLRELACPSVSNHRPLSLPGIDVLRVSAHEVWKRLVWIPRDVFLSGCMIGAAARKLEGYSNGLDYLRQDGVKPRIQKWLQACQKLDMEGKVYPVSPAP